MSTNNSTFLFGFHSHSVSKFSSIIDFISRLSSSTFPSLQILIFFILILSSEFSTHSLSSSFLL